MLTYRHSQAVAIQLVFVRDMAQWIKTEDLSSIAPRYRNVNFSISTAT